MPIDVDAAYRRYGAMVLRRCRRLVRDEGKALDAMHDVFVNLLRSRDRLDGAAPASLLMRMATNVCLNQLRGERRRPEDPDDAALPLSVVAAGRPYGVVVSVDGRGVLTRHAPRDGAVAARSPARERSRSTTRTGSNDAPAFERFFLVTGASPFAIEPVLDAIRRLAAQGAARTGAPAPPPGLAWSDFVLEKVP